ncbi:MAG TPA: T9SS type A sorting domain-containing protein [Parafilimonas sp.]|nr:T9SS type A sorting domain-containing protein [Parafilimonas sp.]
MKKFFTLFCVLITGLSLKAQHHNFKAVPTRPFKGISPHMTLGPAGACDTVNLAVASDTNKWHAYYYTYGQDGYIFGTSDNSLSGFNITEDANYFDISSTANNYITGGRAYFAFANSDQVANNSKSIVFRVYDDAGGVPGTLLGSTSLTLEQIHQDVLLDLLTEFKFDQPIPLPASKQFYVSIDHANFEWSSTTHDSVAIVANGDDDTTGAAFQYVHIDGLGEGWIPVHDFWAAGGNPLDVNLFIFPYVSSGLNGCSVLPVSIFNFGGNIKNDQAYLNWSTAAEINNKGFFVERSKNGKDFTSIGFVKGAGNSNKVVDYTYTDASLKDVNVSKTYYRLNQVDIDGKSTYSKVISLSLDNLVNSGQWKLYPNPVKDVATVELNLAASSKVKARLISRDGKTLLNVDKGLLHGGTQQFYINTQTIAKGSYILRITIGDKTSSRLLIKE